MVQRDVPQNKAVAGGVATHRSGNSSKRQLTEVAT
jgi:hypothetical protein